MKTWKGYNLLDLILILTGMVVVTISGILFGSEWYIIVSTLLGLLCVFTQAKGKIATQFIGIIYFCFYIFISYTQKYYGARQKNLKNLECGEQHLNLLKR